MVSLRTSVTALRDEADRLTVRWDQWESTLVQIRHYLDARRIGRCVVFTELRTIEHVHDEQTALALFATLETGTDLSWCTTG